MVTRQTFMTATRRRLADIEAEIVCARIASPLGTLLLVADPDALLELRFPNDQRVVDPSRMGNSPLLKEATRQLRAYFDRKRCSFTLPLAPRGTPFQRRVWHALERIPYGRTTSYGAIARTIGRPTASRAVGAANGKNPLPIFIPCHRVVGNHGALVGFGGGLRAKRTLLTLEQSATKSRQVSR